LKSRGSGGIREWDMADAWTPQKGDRVLTTEDSGIFIVLDVDEQCGTSKVRPIGQPTVIRNVESKTLTFLN